MDKGDHLMKRKIVANTLLSLGMILALAAVLPIKLNSAPKAQSPTLRFRLVDVGTFGGPNGGYFDTVGARSLNNRGMVTGTADTSIAVSPPFCFNDCFLEHAFLWQNGVLTDLGGLPGVTISTSGSNDINAKGVVAGLAFTGPVDPV